MGYSAPKHYNSIFLLKKLGPLRPRLPNLLNRIWIFVSVVIPVVSGLGNESTCFNAGYHAQLHLLHLSDTPATPTLFWCKARHTEITPGSRYIAASAPW